MISYTIHRGAKNEVNILAEKFAFSGGQIDNNKSPSLERLIDFYNEEKSEAAERVKIGFKTN